MNMSNFSITESFRDSEEFIIHLFTAYNKGFSIKSYARYSLTDDNYDEIVRMSIDAFKQEMPDNVENLLVWDVLRNKEYPVSAADKMFTADGRFVCNGFKPISNYTTVISVGNIYILFLESYIDKTNLESVLKKKNIEYQSIADYMKSFVFYR